MRVCEIMCAFVRMCVRENREKARDRETERMRDGQVACWLHLEVAGSGAPLTLAHILLADDRTRCGQLALCVLPKNRVGDVDPLRHGQSRAGGGSRGQAGAVEEGQGRSRAVNGRRGGGGGAVQGVGGDNYDQGWQWAVKGSRGRPKHLKAH